MSTPYKAVEIIWDDDHGKQNEGWYLRTSTGPGNWQDERVDALEDLPRDESEAELRSIAVMYLWDPDGMTDAEQRDLCEMIEVKR
jgi:hypothetical protein